MSGDKPDFIIRNVNTLVYTSILGLCCLAMEILNLRRWMVPFVIAALAGIFVVNLNDWTHTGPVVFAGLDMSHMLMTGPFTVAFGSLAIVLTGLIVAMAGHFYKDEQHHISDYLSILVFILCGALVLFSYTNLVMLFLGIEIVSISLYILAGSRKRDVRSNEAGFKYFLMGSFASGILLFGIALLYGATKSFTMEGVLSFASTGGADSAMFQIGALMVIAAMMFKVAAVPFHFWSPDVYEGSPALITAFMATLVKVSIFAAFYKLMAEGFAPVIDQTDDIILIVAIATMVIGNIVAITQHNFKRLLAYSGISHAGYMLLAVISIKHNSSGALFFYGAVYGLATIGAFAAAIPVFQARDNEEVDAFNGLGKSNPVLAALLTMCMLSLAGIPPLAGFLGKYYIFSQAIHNGYILPVIVAIVTSMIGVYYYFKVILAMYSKTSDDAPAVTIPKIYGVILVLCVGLSLLLGVWPGLLMGVL